ncbi:hypothetical protein AYI70_g2156 [Smittium culicis]|uniref:Uncharacterized protein n=1 Tax=Smittium culicis TaxID=133412 RepID=A0A1R1Y9S2_9FUNG|nr:hypothetical protein AYI70_g2156 [Smittium culicis]
MHAIKTNAAAALLKGRFSITATSSISGLRSNSERFATSPLATRGYIRSQPPKLLRAETRASSVLIRGRNYASKPTALKSGTELTANARLSASATAAAEPKADGSGADDVAAPKSVSLDPKNVAAGKDGAKVAKTAEERRKIIKPGTPVGSPVVGYKVTHTSVKERLKTKYKDTVDKEKNLKRREEL